MIIISRYYRIRPPSYKLVYNPSKYSCLRIIHQLVIVVICTNLANELGPHPVPQLLQFPAIPSANPGAAHWWIFVFFWGVKFMGESSPKTRVMNSYAKIASTPKMLVYSSWVNIIQDLINPGWWIRGIDKWSSDSQIVLPNETARVIFSPLKFPNFFSKNRPFEFFGDGSPLVNVYITMENHHFYWVNQDISVAIFKFANC